MKTTVLARWMVFAGALAALSTHAALGPEEESLKLSKKLRPVSDEMWNNIVGDRKTEIYEVIKGDTLYDISARLFGDAKYWPKVWALNNRNIMNPHRIAPGKKVAFYPGSGSSLPTVTEEGADASTTSASPGDDTETPAPPVRRKRRSREWQALPAQSWEQVKIALPPTVDPQGFDRRNRITFAKGTGLALPAFTTPSKIEPLGKITGASTEFTTLGSGDFLYIEPVGEMQPGQTYTVTSEPTELKSTRNDRNAYAYVNMGSVRLREFRDGHFIGEVDFQRQDIKRGMILVPFQPKVPEPGRVSGHEALRGTFFTDRGFEATGTATQHRFGHIDRGSQDGVTPGMVFRVYQHDDPKEKKRFLEDDVLRQGDISVLHCSEQFCTGVMEYSVDTIKDGTEVVLVTDLAGGLAAPAAPTTPTQPAAGTLPRIDPGAELSPDEKKELEQMETFDGDTNVPAAETPSASPPPAEAPAAPPAAEPSPAQNFDTPPEFDDTGFE